MRRIRRDSIPLERQITRPSEDLRRSLMRAGRRDGRRNLPELESDAWLVPTARELLNELHHGLDVFFAELNQNLVAYDRKVISARSQFNTKLRSLDRLTREVDEARAAASSVPDRRRLRSLTASQAEARAEVEVAAEALAVARSERTDVIAEQRQRAFALVGFVEACACVYWQANLRSRRRKERKTADNVVALNATLPDWLISDGLFEMRDRGSLIDAQEVGA